MSAPVIVARLAHGTGEVRVALNEFKGGRTIDIRFFEPFTPARVLMGTRHGISLDVDCLPALAAALVEAETRARSLGLIGGDA